MVKLACKYIFFALYALAFFINTTQAQEKIEDYTPPPMFEDKDTQPSENTTIRIIDNLLPPTPGNTSQNKKANTTRKIVRPIVNPPLPPKRPKSFQLSKKTLDRLLDQKDMPQTETENPYEIDDLGNQIIEMDANEIYKRLNE